MTHGKDRHVPDGTVFPAAFCALKRHLIQVVKDFYRILHVIEAEASPHAILMEFIQEFLYLRKVVSKIDRRYRACGKRLVGIATGVIHYRRAHYAIFIVRVPSKPLRDITYLFSAGAKFFLHRKKSHNHTFDHLLRSFVFSENIPISQNLYRLYRGIEGRVIFFGFTALLKIRGPLSLHVGFFDTFGIILRYDWEMTIIFDRIACVFYYGTRNLTIERKGACPVKLYFTRSGAERFWAKLAEVKDELKQVQLQKGKAVERGTWHDNAEFEDLVRKERMLNHRIGELRTVTLQMILVEGPPASLERLRIGHVAKIVVDGEPLELEIGGYEDTNPNSDPPVISYLAPIVSGLIGEQVGTEDYIEVDGRSRHVILTDITPRGVSS